MPITDAELSVTGALQAACCLHHAGIALCQAAGCVVTALDGGPLSTGTGGLLVAADQPTHAVLRKLIDD